MSFQSLCFSVFRRMIARVSGASFMEDYLCTEMNQCIKGLNQKRDTKKPDIYSLLGLQTVYKVNVATPVNMCCVIGDSNDCNIL